MEGMDDSRLFTEVMAGQVADVDEERIPQGMKPFVRLVEHMPLAEELDVLGGSSNQVKHIDPLDPPKDMDDLNS